MSVGNRFRRLRGVVKNAVVWGIGWSAVTFAVTTVLSIAGVLPDGFSWVDGFGLAARAGFIGGIAGAAFSGVIGFLYHGKRLAEISALRFGIGGGIITALFVPAFLQTMNLLSGDGLVPMALVLDDGLWTGVLGAILAGGSLKLAQRADPSRDVGYQDELDPVESMHQLPPAQPRETSMPQRSRATERSGLPRD